jgi:hypothetical protein
MMSSLLESTFVLGDFVSTHSRGKAVIRGIWGFVGMERGVGGEINAGSPLKFMGHFMRNALILWKAEPWRGLVKISAHMKMVGQ